MKLPVPFEFGGKLYAEAEVRRPTGGVIADTKRQADRGDVYAALATFVAGSLESLGDVTDRAQLRALAREMPYVDAEVLAIRALLEAGIGDQIEGVYACPRCGRQLVVEEGDRVSDLPVRFSDAPVTATVQLSKPVTVTNQATGEELVTVGTLEVGLPTMGQLSRAHAKHGAADQIRTQFEAYVEATRAVNGAPPDGHWRSTWGMLVFERMPIADINRLTAELRSWGMTNRIPRVCPGCGKHWEAEVDTAGFFASGLGA